MIPTANGGVNYYRLASFAWEMRKHKNVEVSVFAFQYDMNDPHPWQRDIISNPIVRRQIESLCEIADLVIWQPVFYEHSLDFFMEMRAKYEKPMLVETDDNFIDVPPWNEVFHSFAPGSSIRHYATEHMKLADGMIVTTPHLKETYSQFNRNIHIVPNSLDFKIWDQVGTRKHRYTRIGWIGGRTHVKDLLIIAPAIKGILAKYKDVWFYVVNSALKYYAQSLGQKWVFDGCDKVYYTDRSAPINLYPRFMSHFNFDIGVAPLEDCNFNRGKSNLRWLEYSAIKIPTVATDISHFRQSITHGHDGLLIPNNDVGAWKTALEYLIEDKQKRQQMGRNANKTVKEKFNLRKNSHAYLKLLKEIAGFGMGLPDYGGLDESDADLHSGGGFNERSEPRSLLHLAD